MLPIVNLFQNKGDSSFRFTPVQYNRSLASPLKVDSFRNSLNIHTLNLIKYIKNIFKEKSNYKKEKNIIQITLFRK